QDADPDVAELVAEPLDRDRAIGRYAAGRRALLPEIADQVVRGEPVEPEARDQPVVRAAGVVREPVVELAAERAERVAELDRPSGALAAPERHLAGLAGRRR